MKRIALLLVAALASCGGKPPDPALGGARNGTWVRVEAERNDKPIVWELRENIAVDPAQPDLLTVSWHYRPQHADGQPNRLEEQIFAKFERRLVEKIGDAGTLAAVLTYDQQHDWFFFANSVAAERAQAALEESERAVVAIEAESGVAAEFHARFNARIGQR